MLFCGMALAQQHFSSRRQFLLGGVLGLGISVRTDVFAQGVAPELTEAFLTLQPLVLQALEEIKVRQWMRAAPLLQRAREIVEGNSPRWWPMRGYVLPPLGVVLLELGRTEEAVELLWQAREAEWRMLNGEAGVRAQQLLASMGEATFDRILRDVEFRRQLMSSVTQSGGTRPHPLQALLFDGRLGSHSSEIPLARGLSRLHRIDELLQLYGEALQRPQTLSAAVLAPKPDTDSLPPPLSLGAEYRFCAFGVLLAMAGSTTAAIGALDRALALNWDRLVQSCSFIPSTEVHLGTFNIRRHQLAVALDLALRLGPDERQQQRLVARVVESKGLGMRYAEHLRRLVDTSQDPDVQRASRQLAALENELSQQSGSQAILLAFLQNRLKAAAVLQHIMPTLRRAGLGTVFERGEALIERARGALPDAAFIGFLSYTRLGDDDRSIGQARYARYVVAGDVLELRDVGSRRDIDMQVMAWRRVAMSGAALEQLHHAGQALSDTLLDGLPTAAWTMPRWVIDPDGVLSLLPFEALPGCGTPTLLQERRVSYVTGLAGCISDLGSTAAPTGAARVIADPEYSAPAASDTKPGRPQPAAPASGTVGVTPVPRGMELAPLPETRQEAAVVQTALAAMGGPVEVFIGQQASPQALQFTAPPRLLHVAAHGLLLDGAIDAEDDDASASVEIVMPGRRAALALAGEGGRPCLVLARELQRLPLQGTLVVLSACNTANGRIETGEGVASLRRAVEVAGARASVTAIWAVPSQATTELMSSFYRRMADGTTPVEALRQAKLDLMAKDTAPLAWAGFVLAGRG